MKLFANIRFAIAVLIAATFGKPQTDTDIVRALALRSVATKDNLILTYTDKDGDVTMREVEVVGYDKKSDCIKTRCLLRKQFRMFKINNIIEVRTAGRKTVTPVAGYKQTDDAPVYAPAS